MQFNITVIQINEVLGKKNNRGGQYNQVEVVYKREGKVEAKAFPDFANKDIYDTLKGLEKDGNYTVTTEKVGDFWKWLSVEKTNNSGVAETDWKVDPVEDAKASVTRSKPAGKVLGSNYETKDERAQRQKLIVAQSSLSNAIEFAKALEPKGSTHSPDDIERVATGFYNFVFSIATKDLSDIQSDEV